MVVELSYLLMPVALGIAFFVAENSCSGITRFMTKGGAFPMSVRALLTCARVSLPQNP